MSPGTPSEPQPTRAYVPPLGDQKVAVVARRGRRRRSPGTPGAILLVLVVIVLMGIGRLAEPAAHGRGEITLLPAAAVGAHPFTASVATGHPAPPSATATASGGTGGGEASTAAQVITTTTASQPGLYGGSRTQASCDAPQLLADLGAAPERTAGFAEVEGISAADLQSFVSGLTGVVLRGDTRVTEHGYITDHPSIFQALLQSGTAVLVDHFGIPRVRCLSGDPLTPPVAVTITPRYIGTHWQAFAPGAVTVISAAARPITAFVLTDAQLGRRFTRPAGTDGRADGDAPGPAPAS